MHCNGEIQHENWTLLIALHINASYYVHHGVHRDDLHDDLHDGLRDDLDHKYGW